MGGDVLQGFESVLDKPEDWASPVYRRVQGDERTQIVTFMGARLLALNIGQVHTPMIQNLTGEFPFFGGDEHRTLGLSQQTPDLVQRAVRDIACQPVIGGGSDPRASDFVERLCQRVSKRLALRRVGVYQRITDRFPVLQHGRWLVTLY